MSSSSEALQAFHPVLAGWFGRAFGEPTDVQLQAWASIRSGRHTLIAAPTGSGKTLAALLPCLDRIVREKHAAGRDWTAGVRTLYITPLKALNNDIQHHLVGFISEIEQDAKVRVAGKGDDDGWPGVATAVRTGDTPSAERARMARKPPEVLVTTPESLYLLLTSAKGRAMLRTVNAVIVDEIHGIAGDKRGAHLTLALERLTALCEGRVQRIGVSATQKPMSRMARFLGGWAPRDAAAERDAGDAGGDGDDRDKHSRVLDKRTADLDEDAEEAQPLRHVLGYHPRPVAIIESMMAKTMHVRVTMPDFSRPAQSREAAVWTPIVERLLQLMEGASSVLLFVNSRRLCERLVLRLNEQTGEDFARAHHGSLARERRLEVEDLLKSGQLRCLVATSSLELGIDVGHIDLVLQVDPPMDAASGIQRIGRAGHAVGDVSRGVILARSRSQLPEAAVLCRSVVRREIEAIRLPRQPIDVLSQHIVSVAAAEDIEVDALHALLCGSECYREYTRAQLESVLKVLAGFYPFARPLIDWDRERDVVTRRALTPVAAVTGVGTIPQSSAYPVHHADSRVHLGELDEEYIHESRAGDVFQLGTSSWMISRIDHDRVYVQEAPNRFSEIPFWRNEPGGRGVRLGVRLGRFLGELAERLRLRDGHAGDELAPTLEADTVRWLDVEYGLDRTAAEQLIDLARAQHKALGLPTDKLILIEHYRDLTNQTRVVIHTLFGRKLNRTWLLAIEQQFGRLLPYKLYGNAKDNGIELVLAEGDNSWLNKLWHIAADSLDELLTEAIAGSPMLGISFRRIAETSLLLSRSFTRTPMWQKRLRSEELLKQALPYADQFPYLLEAMRESLHVYLDADGLKGLLTGIAAGEIEIVVRETKAPSPFAAQFIADYVNTQIYEGDGLSAATQLQLLSVSRSMAGALFGEAALRDAVDPAIAKAEEERMAAGQGELRTPDDLYAALKRRGDLSEDELTKLLGPDASFMAEALATLAASGRIAAYRFGNNGQRWICADERGFYERFPAGEDAVVFIAGRFAEHRLSFTDMELMERYPMLDESSAAVVIELLLRHDLIEQAPFAEDADERIWTSRRVAKRLIRLTMEKARKEAEPAAPVRWCAEISRLQHVLDGTQLAGADGLRTVIGQLQGFYLPVSHWESVIFPSRLNGYRKEDLDLLCASGEVIWLGRKDEGEKEGKIAFFLAESRALYLPCLKQARQTSASKHPELLAQLRDGGAMFLTRLGRESGLAPSELLPALIDLVWEGAVANDQFAPMRLHAQTKGKQLAKTGSGLGRWYWTGSLLEESAGTDNGEGMQDRQGGVDAESVLQWTQHLLDSFGLVSKELAGQISPFGWDAHLPALRQLEHLGIVTRGVLVAGEPALQFARREQIAAVGRPLAPGESEGYTIIAAVDLANPFGLSTDWPDVPGAGFARKGGNYLVLQGGRWRYWIESNGRKIVSLAQAPEGSSGTDALDQAPPPFDAAGLKQVLRTVLRRGGLSKIKIEQWNGAAIADSPAAGLLRALGAERDKQALVLWPSNLQ
ncbi:DEAD/DEAH box helicase [Paenibacillus aurantiacus]|uniref:DEAD/DEAH box helicase n=1 Tax=Paenibacillus aurantiacus TaxID=1936118 RepID=A0ABV5KZR1_9BACL